jgi:hypothetical protein
VLLAVHIVAGQVLPRERCTMKGSACIEQIVVFAKLTCYVIRRKRCR